jgi:drug/metabolite transporter (DMT)-like permease
LAQGNVPYTTIGSTFAEIALIGIVVATVSDFFAAGWMLVWNIPHHKGREYIRVLKSRSGKWCVLAGILGGPVAMSTVCVAIFLCPIPYVMAISAAFPVFSAIISSIILRERLNPRLVMGIVIVVIGGALVSWGPPEGSNYPYFWLGILLAAISSFGLALDCCVGTYGMDMVDPSVAVGIKLFASAATNGIIMVPIFAAFTSGGILFGWEFLGTALTVWPYVLLMVAGAIFGAVTWTVNYNSMAIIGASRGTAINASFALWGIPVSLLFSALGLIPYEVTTLCIVGACVLFVGSVMVVMNPKELLNIRSHS